jgi:hypothetical protein
MRRRVGLVGTVVSEESVASIFRVEIVIELRTALILPSLIMRATCSSETTVLTRPKRRHVPEYGIVHSHRRENLKSYIYYILSTTHYAILWFLIPPFRWVSHSSETGTEAGEWLHSAACPDPAHTQRCPLIFPVQWRENVLFA